jgi:gas vesicle protein
MRRHKEEREMSEERGCAPFILLAFLLGGVVGASLAFLFAPVAGAETRGRVRGVAAKVKKKAEGVIEEIRTTTLEFPSVP